MINCLEHSVEVGHKCLLGCGSVMWYLDPHSQELDGIVSNEWDGLSIYQELRVYQFPCRSLQGQAVAFANFSSSKPKQSAQVKFLSLFLMPT